MVYGIGPVRAMGIVGFFLGLLAANSESATGNTLIQVGGLISLIAGIGFLLGGRGIVGLPGGFLTGFGLGATAGSIIWPPTPTIV